MQRFQSATSHEADKARVVVEVEEREVASRTW